MPFNILSIDAELSMIVIVDTASCTFAVVFIKLTCACVCLSVPLYLSFRVIDHKELS